MTKYFILWAILFFIWGMLIGHKSYTPIQKQINVKTMQPTGKATFITKNRSVCNGDCRNRSESSSGSSWGSSGGWGK